MRYIQVRFEDNANGGSLVIRFRSPQALIMLLSVFLLVPVQAMGTVLCIGADGHIALEIANNGRCGDLTSIPSPEHIAPLPQNTEHCGGCLDVTLSASNSDYQQMFSAPRASSKLTAPALALSSIVLPVSVESPQRRCVVPRASHVDTLVTLRTVILLV